MEPEDRAWVAHLVDDEWGLPVVSISGSYDPAALPGLVAVANGALVGAITYHCAGDTCEIITLNALTPGHGVGSALLAAARQTADNAGHRLWLITTNENVRAIEFYQRRGMDLVALHRNFADVVRRHKPAGRPGATDSVIRFRHALELSTDRRSTAARVATRAAVWPHSRMDATELASQ
jgi:GNAT superfamily N-acetyltransferase